MVLSRLCTSQLILLQHFYFLVLKFLIVQVQTHEMPEAIEAVIGERKGHHELEGGPQCCVGSEPLERVEKLWKLLPTYHVLHRCRGNH